MQQNLRPLSFGEILDGAFTLYRRNWPAFVATVLAPGLLTALAHQALGRPLLTAAAGRDLDAMGSALLGPAGLAVLLNALLGVVMWCALVRQASRAYLKEPTSFADGLLAAPASAPALLGAALIAAVCISVPVLAGGLFLAVAGVTTARAPLVVGGPVMLILLLAYVAMCLAVMAVFAIVPPVVVCEGRGSFAAVKRSYLLVRDAMVPVMGLILVITLMEVLISASADALGGAFGIPGAESGAGALALQQALGLAVQVFTTPIIAALLVLLYFDRRVRTEALDVQMMADRLAVAGD